MATPVIALRPAVPGDHAFMWDVQWQALGAYVTAVFGTTRAQQRAYYDEHHDHAGAQIVVVDGVDAGVWISRRHDDHWYLADVALLPQFQGRGVGARLIGDLLAAADAAGVAVRLQVLRSNPRARALYERLGFRPDGCSPTHVRMVRPPGR